MTIKISTCPSGRTVSVCKRIRATLQVIRLVYVLGVVRDCHAVAGYAAMAFIAII